MVALGLICVGSRKSRDRIVEDVAITKIAADHCCLAGTRVRACQRMAAPFGKQAHLSRTECFDPRLDLGVSELAYIEMAAPVAFKPAKENVAGRLHEAVADHDPLPVVGVRTFPDIRLQH